LTDAPKVLVGQSIGRVSTLLTLLSIPKAVKLAYLNLQKDL
jgi:hypothetical protein